MAQRREGLDAGDDRHRDARFAAAAHEVEKAGVVVEELRDDVPGSGVDLRLEGGDVGFGRGGLFVPFGITGHADREFRVVALLDLAVHEFAAVHGRDLPHEVHGVRMSLRVGHEELLVLRFVAPESQHVVQAEEVEVDQRVLDVVFRLSAADQVRHDFDAVLLLNGGRDAHRAGTAAHHVPVDASVRTHGLLDSFAVEGDVDVGWVESDEPVDGCEYAAHAVALEGREQFEREARAVFGDGRIDYVQNIHGSVCCCFGSAGGAAGAFPRVKYYWVSVS